MEDLQHLYVLHNMADLGFLMDGDSLGSNFRMQDAAIHVVGSSLACWKSGLHYA